MKQDLTALSVYVYERKMQSYQVCIWTVTQKNKKKYTKGK